MSNEEKQPQPQPQPTPVPVPQQGGTPQNAHNPANEPAKPIGGTGGQVPADTSTIKR